MSYINAEIPMRMIEVTLSSGQTASQGDFVLFDTIRATGTHGVSVNASTGEVSLNIDKMYYILASIDVDRASTTSDWAFAWCDSAGVELTPSEGSFDANWLWHNASTTTNSPNATFTAVYISNEQPEPVIKLKAKTLYANSTIRTETRLFILEAG